MKNKVIVSLWLESGCSQEDGEVMRCWSPINFMIYSNLFSEMVDEAVVQWLGENKMRTEIAYELILQHEVEYDGGGAVTAEYFRPIHVEIQTTQSLAG